MGMLTRQTTSAETDAREATADNGPTGDGNRPKGALVPRKLRAWLATSRGADAVALSCFVLGALYLTARTWRNPIGRLQTSNLQDQVFFEWTLSHAQWSVTHLSNPLFTDRLNVPDGVNMMANTSILGLSIPLIPVTALFGAPVSFALLLTLGFAATAAAWYWLFSRHLVSSRAAAFVGGAFCGFAPGMVSHGNGHPNIVAQFMVPFIVWRVMRLREPGRAIRNGLILGLMVTYQMFINEEIVFFTAIGCAVFLLAYCLPRWKQVPGSLRPFLAGLGVAALTAGILMAYPLWFQFFGPQHYRGVPIYTYRFRTDVASYWSFATESIAGDGLGRVARSVSVHPAEENTFYGWSLVFLLPVVLWVCRRRPVAVAAAVAGAFFALLTLGHTITIHGKSTGIPGPWVLFERLPLFDSVVPARLSLGVIPTVGLLLAVAYDEVVGTVRRLGVATLPVRGLWLAAMAGALLPIAPTPLRASPVAPVPPFIADGTWRQYISADRSMVTVPPSSNLSLYGMRWAANQDLGFTLAQGYFLGPGGPDGRATFPAPPTPTSAMLDEVAKTGEVPDIGPDEVRAAHTDLVRWRTAIVVLGQQREEVALKRTVEELLGPAQWIGGVWLWDVRAANWQPS
jgi:hypothetical protein